MLFLDFNLFFKKVLDLLAVGGYLVQVLMNIDLDHLEAFLRDSDVKAQVLQFA